MKLGRLMAIGAGTVALVAVLAGTATGAEKPASVTLEKGLVGNPSSIACGDAVDVSVTVTGRAGEKGTATDMALVLDVSGSMAGTKLSLLTTSARKFVEALAASDGDGSAATIGRGNQVALFRYSGSSAPKLLDLGTNATSLLGSIAGLTSASGSSPHNKGIDEAKKLLTGKQAPLMIVFTDGKSTSTSQRNAARTSALNAKTAGVRIITIGIGSDAATTELRDNWANTAATYQAVTSSSALNAAKLLADTGAAVAVPAEVTLTEALGARFTASSATGGTVSELGKKVSTGTLTLAEGQVATLSYTATRDGTDVFSPIDEVISSSTAAVTGGAIETADVSIKVLPCGATFLQEETCAAGAPCDLSGTQGGTSYTFNAGTPGAQSQVQLTGLGSPPPGFDLGSVCSGFGGGSDGVQVDVRPLTTDGTFEVVIPDLTGTGRSWWQTDVCLGTNLAFITKIESLANLRPGAAGSASRFWGLLPSIPRYTLVNGQWIRGPWIKSRAKHNVVGAKLVFVVPYVGLAGFLADGVTPRFTTNGLDAYDPKVYTAP